ncbi:hypothetical protein [Cryptosporangium arvum]|nr:hypothetical protein [Cryptosporangium arvum]
MIDLQVRGESGQVLARARGFEWTQELIDLDRAEFPMLAGLCAFSDTVFNWRQVPMLLNDLQRLPDGVIPEPACAAIREFAATVEEGSHLYLWFVGD